MARIEDVIAEVLRNDRERLARLRDEVGGNVGIEQIRVIVGYAMTVIAEHVDLRDGVDSLDAKSIVDEDAWLYCSVCESIFEKKIDDAHDPIGTCPECVAEHAAAVADGRCPDCGEKHPTKPPSVLS